MREVPRHLFVPEGSRHQAYDDRPLPIGEGQTISQPYMVAIMTEALDVEPSHRVLEIGTGSGYQTAILCRLARDVVSIERHPRLSEAAGAALAACGCTSARLIVGDGTLGDPQFAPFDRILVTAGAPAVPQTLLEQLAEGGRLVIPIGPPSMQYLTIVERREGRFAERRGDACVFVPLVGTHGWDTSSGSSC
jgi:protein-L-isoaspartate(D-aspartate) O-methyltransferase